MACRSRRRTESDLFPGTYGVKQITDNENGYRYMTAGYHTLRELQEQAVLQNREVWEIVRNADMSENERSAEASFEKMTIMYQAMKQADESYNGALRSASGRAGGDGAKLQQYNAQGKNICGDFIGKSHGESD